MQQTQNRPERGTMSVSEAGRIGGEQRKQELGSEGYSALGQKGGQARKQELGPEGYAQLGRKGGQATAATHGRKFFQDIGQKGGQRIRDLIAAGKGPGGRSSGTPQLSTGVSVRPPHSLHEPS